MEPILTALRGFIIDHYNASWIITIGLIVLTVFILRKLRFIALMLVIIAAFSLYVLLQKNSLPKFKINDFKEKAKNSIIQKIKESDK